MVDDAKDNCQYVVNRDQKDSDSDRFGDACDNCIYVYNPKQKPNAPEKFGERCNNPNALTMEDYDYEDDDVNDSEKDLIAQVMKMLMDMYYN